MRVLEKCENCGNESLLAKSGMWLSGMKNRMFFFFGIVRCHEFFHLYGQPYIDRVNLNNNDIDSQSLLKTGKKTLSLQS